jgi:nitrogen fixation/metabolism regulation signal transduction histidine kinase
MSMLVVQTAADPPNHGRIYLLMINCTWNNNSALRKMVEPYITTVFLGTDLGLAVCRPILIEGEGKVLSASKKN